LRCEIAKQFRAVVNSTVSVSIQRQPSVIRLSFRPGSALACAGGVEVEVYTSGRIRQFKAIAPHVNEDGSSTALKTVSRGHAAKATTATAAFLLLFGRITVSSKAMNIWPWTKNGSTTILRQNDGRSRSLLPLRNPVTYILKLRAEEIRKAPRTDITQAVPSRLFCPESVIGTVIGEPMSQCMVVCTVL
jgi:hypothetical protein